LGESSCARPFSNRAVAAHRDALGRAGRPTGEHFQRDARREAAGLRPVGGTAALAHAHRVRAVSGHLENEASCFNESAMHRFAVEIARHADDRRDLRGGDVGAELVGVEHGIERDEAARPDHLVDRRNHGRVVAHHQADATLIAEAGPLEFLGSSCARRRDVSPMHPAPFELHRPRGAINRLHSVNAVGQLAHGSSPLFAASIAHQRLQLNLLFCWH
jgi:hypothetical protein